MRMLPLCQRVCCEVGAWLSGQGKEKLAAIVVEDELSGGDLLELEIADAGCPYQTHTLRIL